MTDHTPLKEAAEAATPGPWDHESKKYNEAIYTPRRSGPSIPISQGAGSLNSPIWGTPEMAKANAAYIAAANPSTILELLDEVERLKARLEQAKAVIAPFAHEYEPHLNKVYRVNTSFKAVHLRDAAEYMGAQDD